MRIIIKRLAFQEQFEEGDYVVRNPANWGYGVEDWDKNGICTVGRVLKVGRNDISRYTVLVEWGNTGKKWWYDPPSLKLVNRIKSEVDHEEEEKGQEKGGLI